MVGYKPFHMVSEEQQTKLDQLTVLAVTLGERMLPADHPFLVTCWS